MSWKYDLPVDNAAFVGVVMDFSVPLVCQLFAASVGGGSYCRASFASLNTLDGTVEDSYKN